MNTSELINLLSIRNSGKGNKYKFTWNGKDKLCNTVEDLASELFNISGQFQAKPWYNDFVAEVKSNPNFKSEDDFGNVWISVMKTKLVEALDAKRATRDANQEATIPSAFNADFLSSTLKPKSIFNREDLDLIKGLSYCEKNNALYYCDMQGNYTFLGDPESLLDKRSETLRKTANFLTKRISAELGISNFDIWSWMWDICNQVTDQFFVLRRQIEDYKSRGTLPSNSVLKWNGNQTNVKELFNWFEDDWSNDFIDDLHTKLIGLLINELLPSSVFRNEFARLRYETKNGLFNRYNLASPVGKMGSFADYISALFSEPSMIDAIPHFNKQPYIIQDNMNEVSTYKIKPDWEKGLVADQFKTIEECKILKTFLTPYSDDEKMFMMAWAYTVLHPSCGEGIGLLIKTGGGAFKTHGFSNMISLLLEKMYGADKDELTYTLIRSNWVKDDSQMREACGNQGISHAALVVNDECDEKSIEKYKDLSGSTSNVGISYTYKKVYQVPVSMRIYCRWLFLTNNQITINDTDGVFERRLAIIDRMDIKSLPKPYSQLEYPKYVERELKMFYDLAKTCYTKLKAKYSDLVDAATHMDFAKNLKQAYADEDKTFIYYKLTENLTGSDPEIMPMGDFNDKVEELCKDFGINPKGMKNWVKNTDKTVQPVKWNWNTKRNGKQIKCHFLYRLKDEFIPKVDEDPSEDVKL